VGITNPPGFIKCGADAGFVGCAMRHGGSLAKGACACNSAGLLLFVRYILLYCNNNVVLVCFVGATACWRQLLWRIS
jgi:hypothetical protein